MSFLMIKLEKLKNKTVVLVLTLFLFIHELACLAGFFVLPFIRYSEKARNIWLIVWIYAAIIFAVDMVYNIYKQCHEKEKEIKKYQQDKVYYWAINIGSLILAWSAFLLVFLNRNQYITLTWADAAKGVSVAVIAFMAVLVVLLFYKGKYKSMLRDLFMVLGLFLGLCLLIAGLLLSSNDKYQAASQTLILIGALPLCLWGIKTFCKMFLSNKSIVKDEDAFAFAIFISLCIAVVLGIMVYYLITDEYLRTIIGSMVAAALTGFITLVGVAWTIKDGNEKRQADFKRVEEERKEEERKKATPYLKFFPIQEGAISYSFGNHINLAEENKTEYYEGDDPCMVEIDPFYVKNISNSNVLLKCIKLDERVYYFENNCLMEKGEIGCIMPCKGFFVSFASAPKNMTLVISDTIGYEYTVSCSFNIKVLTGRQTVSGNQGQISYMPYTCFVQSISLPQLIREDAPS